MRKIDSHLVFILAFAVVTLLSCKQKIQQKSEQTSDSAVGVLPFKKYIPTAKDPEREKKILRVTDTICQKKNQSLGNLELVEFCYIRYGNKKTDVSFSQLVDALQTGKKVDYNYAIGKDDDLIYKIDRDTITIRIFYDTFGPEWLWEPDVIKSHKGIVILKERKAKKSDKPLARGIVVDELIYKFRVIKRGKIPKFRWDPDLDN